MNQIKYGTCAKCRIILNSLFLTKGPLGEMNNYIKRKRAIVQMYIHEISGILEMIVATE